MAKVTLGLLQHACSADPAANLKKALALAEEAARARGEHHLHAGALPLAVLLPERGPPRTSSWRRRSRARRTEAFQELARRRGVVVIASLFEKRASGLYHNTAAVIDADGSLLGIYRKMHIPDDPLYYEKFYFTPGRHGLPGVEDQVRQDRRPDLLGPVVPRGGPADGAAGGGDPLLPDGDRLAPEGEGEARRGAARRLGDDPARARDRQRLLRRRLQPDRPREAGRRARDRVLGAELRRGHERPDPREGRRRRGGDPARARSTWPRWTRPARTGRSCATAGSTPTAT